MSGYNRDDRLTEYNWAVFHYKNKRKLLAEEYGITAGNIHERIASAFAKQEQDTLRFILSESPPRKEVIDSYKARSQRLAQFKVLYQWQKQCFDNLTAEQQARFLAKELHEDTVNLEELQDPTKNEVFENMDKARAELSGVGKVLSGLAGGVLLALGFLVKPLTSKLFSLSAGLLYNSGTISGARMLRWGCDSPGALKLGLAKSVITASPYYGS